MNNYSTAPLCAWSFRSYDDVGKLLRDPEVNAVYIASPVGCHLEHALAVCASGRPCLLEKPMARSRHLAFVVMISTAAALLRLISGVLDFRRCAEEAALIVAAFEAAGLPLYVAYYRRYPPPLRAPHRPSSSPLCCSF